MQIHSDEWKCVDIDRSADAATFRAKLSRIAAESNRSYFDFLKERKKHAAEWLNNAKKKQRIITELVPPSSIS